MLFHCLHFWQNKEYDLKVFNTERDDVPLAGTYEVASAHPASKTIMKTREVLNGKENEAGLDERERIYGSILLEYIQQKLKLDGVPGKGDKYDRWRRAVDSVGSANGLKIEDSGFRPTLTDLDVSLPETIILNYYQQISPQHAEQITKEFLGLMRGQAEERYNTMLESRRADENMLRAQEAEKRADANLELAETDLMTGFANKRGMYSGARLILDKAFRSETEKDRKVCFVLIDIDYFKSANDIFTYAGGNLAVERFAEIIKSKVRGLGMDLLVRYGGDEFVLIIPSITTQDAQEMVKRVKDAFSDGLGEYLVENLSDEVIEKAVRLIIKDGLSEAEINAKMEELDLKELTLQAQRKEAENQLIDAKLAVLSFQERRDMLQGEVDRKKQQGVKIATTSIGAVMVDAKEYLTDHKKKYGDKPIDYEKVVDDSIAKAELASKVSKAEGKNRFTFNDSNLDQERIDNALGIIKIQSTAREASSMAHMAAAAEIYKLAADSLSGVDVSPSEPSSLDTTVEQMKGAAQHLKEKGQEGALNDAEISTAQLLRNPNLSSEEDPDSGLEGAIATVTVNPEKERGFFAGLRAIRVKLKKALERIQNRAA